MRKCILIIILLTRELDASVRHSLEFALNRVLFEIFRAYPKTHTAISVNILVYRFYPIEEQITVRQSKFIIRYHASDGDVCRAISKLKIVFMECSICHKQCLCCMFVKVCLENCVFTTLLYHFFLLFILLVIYTTGCLREL